MYITVDVFCKHCNKEGQLKVSHDEIIENIENNYLCMHCNTKGKLTTVRQ